jgi:hypothetical protein
MADNPLVAAVLFGFDRDHLYLRLEPSDARLHDFAGALLDVEIAVGERRIDLRARDGRLIQSASDGERKDGHVAHRKTLELQVPLAFLGVRAGDRLSIVLRLVDAAGAPLGRYPADGAIRVSVPGDEFEAENWSA